MEQDVDWVTHPEAVGPRSRQLLLVFYGSAPSHAQPLKKYGRRTVWGRARLNWVEKHHVSSARTRDDPAVLPPAVRGQLALFPQRRELSIDVCRRILQRPLQGYDEVVEHTAEFAADPGIGRSMQRKVLEMLRLALAVRDADGDDLVDETVLADIPNFVPSVRAILLRAGMLRQQVTRPWRPHQRQLTQARGAEPTPRSCASCGCWFAARTQKARRQERCSSCSVAARRDGAALGTCVRCGRPNLSLTDGRCRGCRVHTAVHGPDIGGEPWTQLWFGEPVPTPNLSRYPRPRQPRGYGRSISLHLAEPGQGTLFDTRRDWRTTADKSFADLPALTPGAVTLLRELDDIARNRQWAKSPAQSTKRTLTILLSWLGAEAPIREADLYDLARSKDHLSARRATQFLEDRGLLIPDPELRRDTHQRRLENELAQLPETIARELGTWIAVTRGEGRWEHEGRSYRSIHRYYLVLKPVLDQWITGGVVSLRQISSDDVEAAIASHSGTAARAVHIMLRNVFKALRQERVIFRDPTRGLVFSGILTLPPSVPSDQLAGILERTRNPFERFVIVLVGVHALTGTDIRRLLLTDLDLSRQMLIVRRPGRRHVVYLDEITYRCAGEWTQERYRRWPATLNPHLLVNRWTAADAEPAITPTMIGRAFTSVGIGMQTLRQDRILNEAFETADPIHLIRLFGISDTTAMRYITAAHPERTSRLPR